MNIVAESVSLGLRFWFCIDGGYGVPDRIYMTTRKFGTNGPDERTYYKNQQEMADYIETLRKQIADANRIRYERFKLQWMLDHGYTLRDLIHELDEMRKESEPDTSLESIFEEWEFGYGFGSEIWPCFGEYINCEGR